MDRDHWFHDKGKAIEGRKKKGGVVWNILKERHFFTCTDDTHFQWHIFTRMFSMQWFIFFLFFLHRAFARAISMVSLNMFKVCEVFTWFFSLTCRWINYLHWEICTEDCFSLSLSCSSSLSLCAIIPTLYRSHEWFIAYKFFSLIFLLEFTFLNSSSLDFFSWPMNEWIGTSTLMSMKMNQYLLIVLNCFTWTQSNAFIGIQAILIATTYTHMVFECIFVINNQWHEKYLIWNSVFLRYNLPFCAIFMNSWYWQFPHFWIAWVTNAKKTMFLVKQSSYQSGMVWFTSIQWMKKWQREKKNHVQPHAFSRILIKKSIAWISYAQQKCQSQCAWNWMNLQHSISLLPHLTHTLAFSI